MPIGRWKMRGMRAFAVAGLLVLTSCSNSMPGGAPSVLLSATSISFGQQAVGTTTTAQPITLTNSGTAALLVTDITADSEFQTSSTCGASIPPKMSCEITVAFAPNTLGDANGRLRVTDNAVGSPHTIQLSGTGSVSGPRCIPRGVQCPPFGPPCCAGLTCIPASTRAFCE